MVRSSKLSRQVLLTLIVQKELSVGSGRPILSIELADRDYIVVRQHILALFILLDDGVLWRSVEISELFRNFLAHLVLLFYW